jgi:hypothetical protein
VTTEKMPGQSLAFNFRHIPLFCSMCERNHTAEEIGFEVVIGEDRSFIEFCCIEGFIFYEEEI